jgi:uncharacterized protein with HEPN domain
LKKEDRSYKMHLDDLQIAMGRIAEYVAGFDFEHFKWDYKTVDAVIRNFEVIGEASKNLDEKNKRQISKRSMERNVLFEERGITRIFWCGL